MSFFKEGENTCQMVARVRQMAEEKGLDPAFVNCDMDDVCKNLGGKSCLLINRAEMRNHLVPDVAFWDSERHA